MNPTILAILGFLLALELGEGINLPAGTISSGRHIKTFRRLSPYFTVQTKIRINKPVNDYAALWHFTTGANCCGFGTRLPAIFQYPAPRNEIGIWYPLGTNPYNRFEFPFQLGKWYTIEISQIKVGSNTRLSLYIDGRNKWNHLNSGSGVKTFQNVKTYQGSPNTYTDGLQNKATPDISFEYFRFEELYTRPRPTRPPRPTPPPSTNGISLPSGKIANGKLVKTFDVISPFFTLKTKIRINKPINDFAALWHLTTGANCCGFGTRLPAIFQYPAPRNQIGVWYHLRSNLYNRFEFKFELNKWYTIELSQSSSGRGSGRLKLVINGETKMDVRNTRVYTGRNVKLYQGSPNRYTDGLQNKATPDVSFQYFHYSKGDPKCCGVSHRATRIVGGSETEVNEYPWMVYVKLPSCACPGCPTNCFCGGSIIDNQHILTAAHCTVDLKFNEIEVILGEHDTTDSEGIVMQLSNKTEHYNYNPNNENDPGSIDVSILKLRSPISFSLTMSPICLPETTTNLYKDVTATVSGWGVTEFGRPSTVLRDVKVKEKDCSKWNDKYYNQTIIKHHICALNTGKDSCSGDSGGPLFLLENNRNTEIGVVKEGPTPGAHRTLPGVYTRVTEIKEWITMMASGAQDSNDQCI